MLETIVISIPLAVTWMLVTSRLSLDSFIVGFVIALAILLLVRRKSEPMNRAKLPDQAWALCIYSITLARDIWLSSVDVTKRVLNPALPMNPGIIRIETQDASHSEVVTAFSAHGITITPGELVVDFDGTEAMYVHCLDVEASGANGPGAQLKRQKMLNRILGR